MKLVLLHDVSKLGREGDVKDVADGYARNFLLPKGLAVEASSAQLKLLEQRQITERKREEKNRADLEALATKLKGASVTFKVKVGEGGRLYGSITSKDVGDALESQSHIVVDRRRVELDEPLRALGTHQVPVRVASDLHPLVTVVVEEE